MASGWHLPVATIGGKRTLIIGTLQDACFVGRMLARDDSENEDDGEQDGALAFMELQANGVNPVSLTWLRVWITGSGTEEARAKRSKPLRSRSCYEDCEPLPVWAL